MQERWGRRVIESRHWIGNEVVMDAGCGTGTVSKFIAEKVHSGVVYAVDIDSNMIDQARKVLANFHNVKIIESDLLNIELSIKVDVIFSNAAVHWILDHRALFERFWNLLKDDSGELLIQYGGFGNLEKILTSINKVKQADEFKEYFVGWKEPWYFPRPNDTKALLKEIGFRKIKVNLSNEPTIFPNQTNYSKFVKTVIMNPFLERLPTYDLKDKFLDMFLQKVQQGNQKLRWLLEYLRLNIVAYK